MGEKHFGVVACGTAIAVVMAITAPARAEGTKADGEAVKALQEQILQLQQQVQKLGAKMKASENAKASEGQRVAGLPVTKVPNASPVKYARGDSLVLTDTPDGFRLINTQTTSVGIYGLLDLTLAAGPVGANVGDATGNAITSPAGHKPWAGMAVSWMNGNRWGFNGHHDIDDRGDAKLIFKLESEFEIATGNFDTPGTIFNRDAWVGFESEAIGKLTLGRQDALARDFEMNWGDPFGPSKIGYAEGGWSNNRINHELLFYSGSATGNRQDSSIVWKKKWGSNWVTGLSYQFGGVQGGGDFVNSGMLDQGSTQSAAIAYNSNEAWNLSGTITRASMNDRTDPTNTRGYVTITESIGGNVQLHPWFRLNAGYIHADVEQPLPFARRHDDVVTVSAKITPGGKFDYAIGYYHIWAKNAGMNVAGDTQGPFEATNSIVATASGTWDSVYGAMFYRIDSQTDLYWAVNHSRFGGGYDDPRVLGGNKNVTNTGIGVRYFF